MSNARNNLFPSKPAFSTRGTNYTQVNDQSTYSIVIPASGIDINAGNDYNATTGKFTAPFDGNYLFNANGLIYPSNGASYMTAGWFLNGVGWELTQSGETDTNHMHYSNIVLMPLSENDVVDFRLRAGGTMYAYASQWNMHGYLVS